MAEKITTIISEEEIDRKIRELGKQISEDFKGQEVTLICILKGAATFACDLAKRIECPVTMEYMRCSSYGNETESSGVVKITLDLDEPIRNKNIAWHISWRSLRSEDPPSLSFALCWISPTGG